MKNIILFGAPGAGKGTQSAFMVEKWGMVHISTGDLFRKAIRNETALGKEARKYMDQGELVPDAVVIGMVEEVLTEIEDKNFVLDGFPRNVSQAEALENLLKKHHTTIGKVVSLEVPTETLVSRLSSRRVCSQCGAVYNVVGKPPRVEGICDQCGGQVIQRDDDKEEAIRTRLQVYEESTRPLKTYFENQNKLVEIDGVGEAQEVLARVEQALNSPTS